MEYEFTDNVIRRFAAEFEKVSPYSGAGNCHVRYSPERVTVRCHPDSETFASMFNFLAVVCLIYGLTKLKKWCD
jgi:hypothetical protein